MFVFAGVAAAFALHVALAVAAGSLLILLPHRLVEITVTAAFVLGAVLLLTQILAAGRAARYHNPVAVGLGSVLALWAVAGVAITGGRGLLKVIPLAWITRAAALAMVVLAGISLAAAIR